MRKSQSTQRSCGSKKKVTIRKWLKMAWEAEETRLKKTEKQYLSKMLGEGKRRNTEAICQ